MIERGQLLCYRVFDAGDTLLLDRAERLLGARRFDFGGPLTEGLVMPVGPLEVPLDPCVVQLPGHPELHAGCRAHLFEFGALSIEFAFAIEDGATLAELTPLCDALYESPELDRLGRAHRTTLLERLGDAVVKPHDWQECESYTIVFAERVRGTTVAELQRSHELAQLLLGERQPLSAATQGDVLKSAASYLADDLVVADWNSAFVVEPSGSRVVPFVLELATCQLLEFRYYDEILERELAEVYDTFENARPRVLRSPYGKQMRKVVRRLMELTEFTERVDNSIKSVGDFYLSRVYQGALSRFRVPEWRESVESKLRLVDRAYQLLKDEVEVSRGQLLEIIVVVLIFIELLAALRPH